jgi:hypothetical protein
MKHKSPTYQPDGDDRRAERPGQSAGQERHDEETSRKVRQVAEQVNQGHGINPPLP